MTDDEKLEIIREIRNTSYKTYHLVDSLSSWSKKTATKIEAVPQNLKVSDVLLPSIDIAELVAKRKRVSIINEITEDILIRADRNLISTVLRNLLLNAVRFSPDGGKVLISIQIQDKNCQFCISDQGPGIENPLIFDLFNKNKNFQPIEEFNINSLGMGLLFCKEFIEKSGGRIWFETEKGKGTRFYFTLPR